MKSMAAERTWQVELEIERTIDGRFVWVPMTVLIERSCEVFAREGARVETAIANPGTRPRVLRVMEVQS